MPYSQEKNARDSHPRHKVVYSSQQQYSQHLSPANASSHLHLRRSSEDLRRGLVGVLLEVLAEQLAELGDLALEVRGAGPALGRVEELVGHAGAGLGDGEVEGLVDLVLLLGELAGVDGVEDGAGVLELGGVLVLFFRVGEWGQK